MVSEDRTSQMIKEALRLRADGYVLKQTPRHEVLELLRGILTELGLIESVDSNINS
jgi:DNA-binding NarL/FixJ family response regulator